MTRQRNLIAFNNAAAAPETFHVREAYIKAPPAHRTDDALLSAATACHCRLQFRASRCRRHTRAREKRGCRGQRAL